MPRSLLALLLAALLFPRVALPQTGQPLPTASPESVGMSSERLARIGDWLDGIVDRGEAAGFVTLVSRHGKVVHHEVRGTRGLSNRAPMPIDAIFDLASMTKPVTVVAALSLLEEGRYTLSDDISEYLPEFKDLRVRTGPNSAVPAQGPITIRHLFTHSSGITGVKTRPQMYAFPTLTAYVHSMARTPLTYQPGSSWLYGTSHDVLGHLAQRVAERPLDRLVKSRILDPLGMTDTHYWPPAEKSSRRAVLVVKGKDDPDSLSRRSLEAAQRRTYIGGSSGLYSTATDYWRFCQMLLNGGELNGERILGPRTVSWIAQDHLGAVDNYERPGTVFGLGFAVVSSPAELGWYASKGTYFWGGSQGTVFWIDPQEDLIAILMVQVTPRPRMRLRGKLSAIVYSAITD